MKHGIADYGILVWNGGFYDYEDRLLMAKRLGYDGIERLYPVSPENAIEKAAWLKKNGLGFATCNGANAELSIKWTAALGGEYIWADVQATKSFEDYLRQVEKMAQAAKKYGIKVAVHNHMGQRCETQEQVERVLSECPDAYLLLDTGHLALAGGDVRYIVEKYYDRIAAYHLKGWKWGANPKADYWGDRGYFTGLMQGDLDVPNEWVYKNAIKRGFKGWVMIEQDTHKREPELDLAENREILKRWEQEAK